MAELQQGDIREQRRGSSTILRSLLNDMAEVGETGYIRSELLPKDSLPSEGQLLVLNGVLHGAIHEKHTVIQGVEALLEIEDDAQRLECLISVHVGVDIERIVKAFPRCLVEQESGDDDAWWQKRRLAAKSAPRMRLPELEASESAPEFIRRRAESMFEQNIISGNVLKHGDVHLLDSTNGDDMFRLAAALADNGRPVLVIARQRREDLIVRFGLPADSVLWLSEAEHEQVQNPSLESIRQTIDSFLEDRFRAVLMFEGIEYIAGIHGEDRLIDLMRDLADTFRFGDHCLLSTCDLSAFADRERSLLTRELTLIEDETIQSWLTEKDSLLDHPFMAPPDSRELALMAELTIAKTEIVDIPAPIEFPNQLEEEVDEELSEMMQQWARESSMPEVEEEIVIDEDLGEPSSVDIAQEQVMSKGPRPAQRQKRAPRRKAEPAMTSQNIDISGLRAAAEKEGAEMEFSTEFKTQDFAHGHAQINDFQNLNNTDAMAHNVVELPDFKNQKHSEVPLSDMLRNSKGVARALPDIDNVKSLANVISAGKSKAESGPLAARGVSITRNLTNRREGSSRSQKKTNPDTTLSEWKNWPEPKED